MVDIELIKLKKRFNRKIDKIVRKDIIQERRCRKRNENFGTRKQVNQMLRNTPDFEKQAEEFIRI